MLNLTTFINYRSLQNATSHRLLNTAAAIYSQRETGYNCWQGKDKGKVSVEKYPLFDKICQRTQTDAISWALTFCK